MDKRIKIILGICGVLAAMLCVYFYIAWKRPIYTSYDALTGKTTRYRLKENGEKVFISTSI